MPSSGRRIKTFSVSISVLVLVLVSIVIVIASLLTLGSMAAQRYRKKHRQMVAEAFQNYEVAVQRYEALQEELQEIRKSYSAFRSVIEGDLGIEMAQPGDGLGKGGPEMSELEDVSVAGLYSVDETIDDTAVELPSVMVETASLKSGIEHLARIADAKIDELAKTPSIWPVNAEPGERWISSSFGWRKSPFTGAREMHAGLDISGRHGTPIIAPADGTIAKMKRDRFLGKFIEISHNEKFSTMYGHLDDFAKGMKLGTEVKRGEVIGYMGKTGRTTGCHLHYEVRVHDKRVNPIEYILD